VYKHLEGKVHCLKKAKIFLFYKLIKIGVVKITCKHNKMV